MSVAIRTQGLGKRYRIGASTGRAPYGSLREEVMRALHTRLRRPAANPLRDLWALQDIDFEVGHGEALGIIGRNGAGKSTLLKILSRITEPTTGRLTVRGRVGSLLEVGTGFHPELTGRENIFLNGAILGMSKVDIDRSFDQIVAFAEIERFLDTPVKHYSSGMYMRLAFSVAAHLDPDVLVVDEVLAVGDAEFQKKCIGRMEKVAGEGRTVLFVSHNLSAIQRLCQRALLLDHGRLVVAGDVSQVATAYLQQNAAAGTRIDWDADVRPGDQIARLCSMELRQAVELAPGVFSSSQPTIVQMEIEIFESQLTLQVGFEVLSADGQAIFVSNHTDVVDGDVPLLGPGRHKLSCAIPGGWFNGGTYQIRPLMSLYNTRWIVNGDPILRWTVHLDHPRSPYWYSPRSSLMAPALRWQSRFA